MDSPHCKPGSPRTWNEPKVFCSNLGLYEFALLHIQSNWTKNVEGIHQRWHELGYEIGILYSCWLGYNDDTYLDYEFMKCIIICVFLKKILHIIYIYIYICMYMYVYVIYSLQTNVSSIMITIIIQKFIYYIVENL